MASSTVTLHSQGGGAASHQPVDHTAKMAPEDAWITLGACADRTDHSDIALPAA